MNITTNRKRNDALNRARRATAALAARKNARIAELEAENLRLVATLKLSRQYVEKCAADDMPIRISIRAAGVLRAIDNVLDSGSRQ